MHNSGLPIHMNQRHSKRGGEACIQLPDGSFSDAALHEQLTEGVDDCDFRAGTRAKLHAQGVPAAALNRLFPDLTPLLEE
jgi:hypothetical protein